MVAHVAALCFKPKMATQMDFVGLLSGSISKEEIILGISSQSRRQ